MIVATHYLARNQDQRLVRAILPEFNNAALLLEKGRKNAAAEAAAVSLIILVPGLELDPNTQLKLSG
jgi:hypothetical protein